MLPISRRAEAQGSQRSDHYATGTSVAVTSTSLEATTAAIEALQQGGNAADAYLTAALAQTVAEPGLTSIGGGLEMKFFRASSGEIESFLGRLGPAAAEPYDFERGSPITRTGRAMPVPGFLAGIHAAHEQCGQLPWRNLFEPAIELATDGVAVPESIINSARRNGVSHPEGRELWTIDGRFLELGERLVQADLARTLQTVADDGVAAFYEGEFASHYVERAAADGGVMTREDMGRWREVILTSNRHLEGDYRGHSVVGAGLNIYSLHLNEALDLKGSGPADSNPESVYKQIRIMEEVFHSTKLYSDETHDQFVSPEYARERADFVLNSPVRELTLDALFNTCFLVVRDGDGNCAWGTHSINTPTAFGAGILVDGVYAAHAINRNHVHGSGASAPGISTSFALFKDGRPRLIAGSPGFGFVHGPYQYGTGIVEWDLSPVEAMNLPRFALPNQDGTTLFENHYDPAVFEMLAQREIAHTPGRHSATTGVVGALFIDEDETLHVVQDGRRSGWAKAM